MDTGQSWAEILTIGYSYHEKPLFQNHRSGLNSYLFRLQTEGFCRAIIGGKMCLIQTGDLLLYKPGDSYELIVNREVNKRGKTSISSGDYYVMCRGTWLNNWWNHHQRPAKINILPEEGILLLWRQMILEKRRMREVSDEIVDSLLRTLCLYLDRAITRAQREQPTGSTLTAYRIKHYIEQNAVHPFTLQEVSRHIGLSVSRAVNLFKAAFDQSIMEYAMDVRLSMACEQIQHSSSTLEQAAEAAGFRNYTYFHRVFRARFGISPKEYRQGTNFLSC